MKRLMPLLMTVVALVATAAHCEAPPPASYPESATLELLTGPDVSGGDTLRFRVGLDLEGAPWNWTLTFTGPSGEVVSSNYTQFPDGECGALSGRVTQNFNPVKRFVEAECVFPAHYENGSWHVSVSFSDGMVGPTLPFEVTGGSDDHSGPTMQFTELPTQPVSVGQSFEVAARVTDPNGFIMASYFLQFTDIPGPVPACELLTPAPYPTFDLEVRFRCTTTQTVAGVYSGLVAAPDYMRRVGRTPSTPIVTIV